MYDKDNDIERMLQEDIRDKKTAGRGVFNRASRKGYTGTVRTQVDFLKGKAKKEYMGNGDVKVSNIYDDIKNIPSVEQLRAMENKDVAKRIIEIARKKHKIIDLVNHWGFSDNYLYSKFFPEFDIQTRPTRPYTKHVKEVKESAQVDDKSDELFTIKFSSGDIKGDVVKDRIGNILCVLNPEAQYEVKLSITERSE